MSKKTIYKEEQERFLAEIKQQEGILALGGGVLYKIIEKGDGTQSPSPRSVVTCHYKGSLSNGKVFDETFTSSCPAAFRVNELIEGFQMALVKMHVGDHWIVYIPAEKGYGNRGAGSDIPGNSTLIFEIQLISIG